MNPENNTPPTQPPEYVTVQQFEQFRTEVLTELKSLKASQSTQEASLTAAQDKQTGDMMAITALLQNEQHERKADIDSLRLNLSEMANQLRTVSSGITTLTTTIAELSGTMRNWGAVLEAQNRQHDALTAQVSDHNRKIEQTNRDIDLLVSSGAANTVAIDGIIKTIHGDTSKPHDRQSIFEMLQGFETTMKQGFQEQTRLNLAALTLGQTAATRLDAIETQQKQQAEKWQRRKQAAMGLVARVGTKPIAAAAVTTAIGTIIALFPDSVSAILAEIIHLLGGL